MKLNFETVLWGVLMLDSIFCCGFAWTTRGVSWYVGTFPWLAKQFPLARGWSLFYLGLTGWIGCALYRLPLE
ncbi:MAG TPA: hypothetical protein QF772_09075 [Nitrospinaceae bacterium]|nr:hypothetical protein [Nitrospinaceae bacterium]